MKFMFIIKSVNRMGPSPKLLEEMQKLTKREIEAGRLIDNGALTPMSQGAEVRVAGGRLQVIDGPYAEAKEVVGGYAVFELKDKRRGRGLSSRVHAIAQGSLAGLGRNL